MLIIEAVECSKGEGFFLEKPGGHVDVACEPKQDVKNTVPLIKTGSRSHAMQDVASNAFLPVESGRRRYYLFSRKHD
jgi:hypothetical protein